MAMNVLIVDDSKVMRKIVIATLHLSRFPLSEVHEAANGQEALQVLNSNRIDLALVDLNIPVMDGEEMIERVRQNPVTRDLPIVVTSSESSETRIERLKQRGVGFVHKPFAPETLRDAILSAIGGLDEQNVGKGTL